MKKNISILIIAIINTVIYHQNGLSIEVNSKHKLNFISHNLSLENKNKDNLSLTINSDYVEGYYPDNLIFIGNVNINQNSNYLHADRIKFYQKYENNKYYPTFILNAFNNVYFDNNQIIIEGKKGWINLDTKDFIIWDSYYHLANSNIYGKADWIKQDNKSNYIFFKNGTFTSCLCNTNIWNILGNEIFYDRKKQVAKLWNVKFKIGSIPIFYSPYFQFPIPIGNQRYSGFLTPDVKFTTLNHFEFIIPYYWNIKNNMDITIIPHYMYRSNILELENELRYFIYENYGSIKLIYLPLYEKGSFFLKKKYRYLFSWKHEGILNKYWYFDIDFNKFKNNTNIEKQLYLDNFSFKNKIIIDNNNSIPQLIKLCYLSRNFNFILSKKNFKLLSNKLNNNYSAEPQLDINWCKNKLKPFMISIYGQIVNFTTTKPSMPDTIRIYIEPKIGLLWFNQWLDINTEFKFMGTHYQQKYNSKYNQKYNSNWENSFNRIQPQFKINSKIILEREINWTKKYTHTIEPRIQYLYILYYNHKKIKNYDSSLLYLDYDGLFRDRAYSGLDRIVSANQIVIGFTTHIYSENSENFSLSVGKIHYFDKPKTNSEEEIQLNKNNDKPLVWAGNVYLRISDKWKLRGIIQHDDRLYKSKTKIGIIEYYYNEDNLMQLSYHYIYSTSFNSPLSKGNFINEKSSKISTIAGLSINNNWSLASSFYYDINNRKIINQILGLQYKSCCHTIYLGYKRKIHNCNTKNKNKYNNIIEFNIELRGLNSNPNLGLKQILNSNFPTYYDSL